MRRHGLSLILVVTLVTSGACLPEFTDPSAQRPVVLNVFVGLDDASDGVRVHASGSWTSGRDAEGGVREPPGTSILVMDSTLPPDRTDNDGTLSYNASWTLQAPAFAGAVVSVASLASVPEADLSLGVAVPWSTSSTVNVPFNQDLILQLAAPSGSSIEPATYRSWVLEIRKGAAAVVYVSSQGPPPLTIVIPGSWLAAHGTGSLEAELRTSQFVSVASASGSYVASLRVDARLVWSVTVL